MADAYGNVINAPGFSSKATVLDDELLYSYAYLLQKGVTLKPGQGVLLLGTPLEYEVASGQYVVSLAASTITKGLLRTGVDTGTAGSQPTKLANIVLGGIVKKALVDAANAATALSTTQKTALGVVRVDAEFGFYRF